MQCQRWDDDYISNNIKKDDFFCHKRWMKMKTFGVSMTNRKLR